MNRTDNIIRLDTHRLRRIERPEPIDLEEWFLSRQHNAPSRRGERITALAAFIVVGLTLSYFAFRLFGPIL